MYYEVYADVLFAENLWMDAMLLLLTAWAAGRQVRPGRIAAGACAGSLGACALTFASASLSGTGYFLGTAAVAAVMTGIAFPNKKGYVPCLVSLYAESFALGGILRYLEQFHALAGLWFAAFSALAAALLLGIERLLALARKNRALTCPVLLECGSCRILAEALCDTGNSLYDPVSGSPVSILSGELLERLLLEADRELLPRAVPYRTISESGTLTAYVLDRMEIRAPQGVRVCARPMLARMPGQNSRYQLILHRDLLSS
ncbi:MAG: sigma-E processing peptidase SpoIIGA [Eubacteriales bacterium]|nr:sigma-E processing peptidase SpoIIGA [Eubacteriales bacterium]